MASASSPLPQLEQGRSAPPGPARLGRWLAWGWVPALVVATAALVIAIVMITMDTGSDATGFGFVLGTVLGLWALLLLVIGAAIQWWCRRARRTGNPRGVTVCAAVSLVVAAPQMLLVAFWFGPSPEALWNLPGLALSLLTIGLLAGACATLAAKD